MMRFGNLIGRITCNAHFDGPNTTGRVADAEVILAVHVRGYSTWTPK